MAPPGTEPEALLASLLAGLQHNDEPAPDSGIDRVQALASDRMRATVGDAASFRRAFHNALYAPLLGHRRHTIERLERLGDSARGTVAVLSADGATVTYLVGLRLSRHGARAGAWLVSGVVREGVDL